MHHQWILAYERWRHRAAACGNGFGSETGFPSPKREESAPEIVATEGAAERLAHGDDQIVAGRR